MHVPEGTIAMSLAEGTFLHVETRERIRALRQMLGMTQQQVADKSDGRLDRLDVVKLENGQNGGSSARVHEGLAAAFGVSTPDLSAYLDGGLTLGDLEKRREQPFGSAWEVLRATLRRKGRWTVDVCQAVVLRYKTGTPPEGWDAALDAEAAASKPAKKQREASVRERPAVEGSEPKRSDPPPPVAAPRRVRRTA